MPGHKKSKGMKMGGKMRSKGGAMMKAKGMRRGGGAGKAKAMADTRNPFTKARKKFKRRTQGMGGVPAGMIKAKGMKKGGKMMSKGYAKGGAMKSKGGAKGGAMKGMRKPSNKNSGLFGR